MTPSVLAKASVRAMMCVSKEWARSPARDSNFPMNRSSGCPMHPPRATRRLRVSRATWMWMLLNLQTWGSMRRRVDIDGHLVRC